jgi:multidrug efflux system outer membrane protein
MRHSPSISFSLPAVAISAIAILGGCRVGPKYERPTVDAPKAFRSASTQPAPATSPSTTQPTLGDLMWWDAFNDPALKQLIVTALQNNYDLRIAITRIDQANAQRMQALAQFVPTLGYSAGAAGGRNAFLGTPRPTESIDLPNLGTVGPDPYGKSYLAAFSAAWEIDLWGRIRSMNDAALAQYLATREARRDIDVTLVSAVAQSYFQLLALDLQRQIAVSTAKSLQDSLDLFTQKYQGGAASLLEVERATATQAQVAANIPEIDRQIALQENQLSTLCGQNPGSIHRGKAGLVDIKTPRIPVGLPSQLLERRPDIREAEDAVRAANAQVGVAHANFFPRVGLSALFGGVSTDLSKLTSPDARTYSIGATLTGPIFEGGALKAQYRQAKAAWEKSKLQYQQAALTAFREVADALISRQRIAENVRLLQRATDAAQRSVTLSSQRYQDGKAAYFEVLDAQNQLYADQSALAQAKFNELNAFVQLYKALGGGWNASDLPEPHSPTTMPHQ